MRNIYVAQSFIKQKQASVFIDLYYANANCYTHTKKIVILNNYLLSGGLCTSNNSTVTANH